MSFNALSLPALIVGVLLLLLGLRLLLRRGLLAHFLALVAALAFLSGGTFLVLAGLDLVGYQRLLEEEPVASIRFDRLGPQRYRVSLIDGSGAHRSEVLRGEQWQLDVRMIRWDPRLARFGLKPLYRLDRLSGRFADVADERQARRTVYDLGQSPSPIDTWALLDKMPAVAKLVDTRQGSATFMPMVDGGHFTVSVNSAGLVARPINDKARAAVENW